MAIKHIENMNKFQSEVIDSEKITIVDFWAPWCGPCRMIGPIFEEISEEYEDVEFVKVNVDDSQEIAGNYNIMSIPTLLIIKDGEVADQQMGALSKDQLKEFIDKNNTKSEE